VEVSHGRTGLASGRAHTDATGFPRGFTCRPIPLAGAAALLASLKARAAGARNFAFGSSAEKNYPIFVRCGRRRTRQDRLARLQPARMSQHPARGEMDYRCPTGMRQTTTGYSVPRCRQARKNSLTAQRPTAAADSRCRLPLRRGLHPAHGAHDQDAEQDDHHRQHAPEDRTVAFAPRRRWGRLDR